MTVSTNPTPLDRAPLRGVVAKQDATGIGVDTSARRLVSAHLHSP